MKRSLLFFSQQVSVDSFSRGVPQLAVPSSIRRKFFFRMKTVLAIPWGLVRGQEDFRCEHDGGMIIALDKRDNN